MDPDSSEFSANYVYNTLLQDKALRLKPLFKDIFEDYDNPACDYIVRQCKSVKDLQRFLRDFTHLFVIENDKVAKYDEKLESGREAADRYFEENLLPYNNLSIEILKKYLGKKLQTYNNYKFIYTDK